MYKVLVIDEDKLIRWSLQQILSQEGYEVETANSTREAKDALLRNIYDLIFACIENIEDNTIEAIQELLKSQLSAKIVIISSYPRSEVERLIKPARVFSVIEKPFNGEEIKAIVREALL